VPSAWGLSRLIDHHTFRGLVQHECNLLLAEIGSSAKTPFADGETYPSYPSGDHRLALRA
jgi:hypothetical protein